MLFPNKASSSEESPKNSSESSSESSSAVEDESESDEDALESSQSSLKELVFFFLKCVSIVLLQKFRAAGKATSEDDGSSSSVTSGSIASSSSGSEESEDEESEPEIENKTEKSDVATNNLKPLPIKELKSNLDLLLDLDISDTVAPVMTPSLGGFLSPLSGPNQISTTPSIQVITPAFYPVKEIELLDRISGRGLGITYRYTRNPHLFSANMVNINLSFKNTLSDDITDIRMGKKVVKKF